MHEAALTQSILNIAMSEAERHGARKVLSVRLKVGDYTGTVPACVEEYFSLMARGTKAEGASLCIERVPAEIRCSRCGAQSRVAHFQIVCPLCGSDDIKLITGREFRVESIEVA